MKKIKVKEPSVKGLSHMGYLGHFAKDKHVRRGHNDAGGVLDMDTGIYSDESDADKKLEGEEEAYSPKKTKAPAAQAPTGTLGERIGYKKK